MVDAEFSLLDMIEQDAPHVAPVHIIKLIKDTGKEYKLVWTHNNTTVPTIVSVRESIELTLEFTQEFLLNIWTDLPEDVICDLCFVDSDSFKHHGGVLVEPAIDVDAL